MSAAVEGQPQAPQGVGDWRVNLGMFVATLASVFLTGAAMMPDADGGWLRGWPFAVPLLLILGCHEFGHWIAARVHGVPASLPYFIPLPLVSHLGTLGAVIVMPERIRSRNALLDIGAAGPIAGMLVALPTIVVGLHLSEVQPASLSNYMQEGQSLLYWALKRMVLGPMPEGHDVFLHPTAFAGWAGFFVTMINLLPWGQLDGGHIAFALLGEPHHRLARWVRRGLLGLFALGVVRFVVPVLLGSSELELSLAIGNAAFWLVWFGVTGAMGRYGGHDHPPCEPGQLTRSRQAVAIGCMVLFMVLFMPTPMAFY